MATALGLDNRYLLPPFMPVFRNQDGLFGLVLRKCFPDSSFAHIPWAVRHEHTHRNNAAPEWKRATRIRFCDIARAGIESYPNTPECPSNESPLAGLGRHLIALGSLNPARFRDFVTESLIAAWSAETASLRAALQMYPSPPHYWAEDIEAYIERGQCERSGTEWLHPSDLCEGSTSASSLIKSQAILRQYGDLLVQWQGIVEAARSLPHPIAR
jgi:hypothetical protein